MTPQEKVPRGIIIPVPTSKTPCPFIRSPCFVHRASSITVTHLPSSHPTHARLFSALVTARTPSTPTIHTLNAAPSRAIPSLLPIPLQPGLGHPTNTSPLEIRLFCLHTPQTTQLLVPLLLPLGDQIPVRVPVLEQPLVQRLADGFARVVQVVDVAGAGVRDLEDRPEGLVLLFALVRRVLCVAHLVAVFEKCVFDVFKAWWWGFARVARAYRRHWRRMRVWDL